MASIDAQRLDADDFGVSWLPLYHDMGLIGFILAPMRAQRSVDPLALLRLRAGAGGAGASVAVGYCADSDAATRLAEEAGAGGMRITLHQGDLAVSGSCRQLVEQVTATHERIDLLVNNAGITSDGIAVSLDDDSWDAVLAVNLTAAFRLSRLVLPGMLEAGGGRIVNIGSVVAGRGNIGQANYVAAKAGLIGLTKTLARETAFALSRRPEPPEPRGLTVNAVAPGLVATEMVATIPERALARLLAEIPCGRLAEPAEIARVVRFMCEDDSSYVTGQTWHVNGGMTM